MRQQQQEQHQRRPRQQRTAAAPARTSGSSAGDVTKCGTKPGVKATGTPIKLGAIVTKQPGTDFTDGATMAAGVLQLRQRQRRHQRPPDQLHVETEQTDPAQIARLAKKLIQTDKVVGIVGGFSIIECAVDHKYWESLGIYEIDAGIAPECWGTPNSAAAEHGSALQLGRRRSGRGSRRAPRRSRSTSQTSPAPATSPPAPPRSPRASTCRSRRSRTTCRFRTPTRSPSSSCRPPAPTAAWS